MTDIKNDNAFWIVLAAAFVILILKCIFYPNL